MAAPSPTDPPAAGCPRIYRVTVSLWRQSLVLRQLALALGGGLLVVALLLILLGAPLTWAHVGRVLRLVGLLAALFAGLAAIAIGVFYGGRYQMVYRLDAEGIEARPEGGPARRNRLANLLLLLSGQPAAMGAGLLAASRQVERAAWRQVKRLECDQRGRTLTLHGGAGRRMVLFTDAASARPLAADIAAAIENAQAEHNGPA